MSEAVLGAILTALDDLKLEVSSLKITLHAAEEKIARLERATFTPESSSPKRIVSGSTRQEPDIPDEGQRRNSGTITKDEQSSCPRIDPIENKEFNDAPVKKAACNGDSPCDIRRHLKPVNDNLAMMTIQLSRIEQAMKHPPSGTTVISATRRASLMHSTSLQDLKEERLPLSPSKEELTVQSKYPRMRYSIANPCSLQAPSHKPNPIFGQASTPSRPRFVSLDLSGSPFASYSDERSPFSRLTQEGVGRSALAQLDNR